jgi:hypothetical protein
MKNTGRKMMAAAAISGMLSGAAIHQARAAATNAPAPSAKTASPGKPAPQSAKPTVHDCAGENDCKGAGGCQTDAHKCKFKNDCKGRGGCHTTKQDIADWEKLQKSAKDKPAAKPADKSTNTVPKSS